MHAELQKSIDENLEALRKITNSLFTAKFVADLTRSMFPLNVQKGLVAGPALAILGAMSADEMKEKLEKAKAYYSQVEKAVKKADAIIDQFQATEKMAKLFTRQITKCDALFFSLSQDAIATMKKHHYDTSRYNQKEKDQLCVAVSTLMTLSAFLKVPIIDKHQKLQEKAQRALEIMKGQMDSLESGRYDVKMIQSRQQDLENL